MRFGKTCQSGRLQNGCLDCRAAAAERILVGPDAAIVDAMVREDPDHAYEPEFYLRFAEKAGHGASDARPQAPEFYLRFAETAGGYPGR